MMWTTQAPNINLLSIPSNGVSIGNSIPRVNHSCLSGALIPGAGPSMSHRRENVVAANRALGCLLLYLTGAFIFFYWSLIVHVSYKKRNLKGKSHLILVS